VTWTDGGSGAQGPKNGAGKRGSENLALRRGRVEIVWDGILFGASRMHVRGA